MEMQADLIDHLFNSGKSGWHALFCNYRKIENGVEAVIEHVKQETLAEMVGTSRSRVFL